MLAFLAILSVVGAAIYATYLITKRRTEDRITTAYCDEREDNKETAAHNRHVWSDLCDWRDALLHREQQIEQRERAVSPRDRFSFQPEPQPEQQAAPLLALHGKPVDWAKVEESLGRGTFEAEATPCFAAVAAAHPEIDMTHPDQPQPGGGDPTIPVKPVRVLRKHKRAAARLAKATEKVGADR